jgi:hypothetical protein
LAWELADNITDKVAEILHKLCIPHAPDSDAGWKYIKQKASYLLHKLDIAFPDWHPKRCLLISLMRLYALRYHLLNNYVLDPSTLSKILDWFDDIKLIANQEIANL